MVKYKDFVTLWTNQQQQQKTREKGKETWSPKSLIVKFFVLSFVLSFWSSIAKTIGCNEWAVKRNSPEDMAAIKKQNKRNACKSSLFHNIWLKNEVIDPSIAPIALAALYFVLRKKKGGKKTRMNKRMI